MWLFGLVVALPELRGSLCGGTEVEAALPPGLKCPADAEIRVRLGAAPCEKVTRFPSSDGVKGANVRCESTLLAVSATTSVPILVACGDKAEAEAGTFVYDLGRTPVVEEAGPAAGYQGDVVHLVGHGLLDAQVLFGADKGDVKLASGGVVQAVVPPLPAGDWAVRVKTADGFACPGEHAALSFQALLSVQSTQDGAGSFGGGGDLVMVGTGLNEVQNVTLCGAPCAFGAATPEPPQLHAGNRVDALRCRPSAYEAEKAAAGLDAVLCDLAVVGGGQTAVVKGAWRYDPRLTPVVRSVTQGPGDHLTVNGENLDAVPVPGLLRKAQASLSALRVAVGGVACTPVRASADFIECAPEHPDPVGPVVVNVEGKGTAVMPPAAVTALAPPTPPPKEPLLEMHAYASELCHADAAECPAGWKCCKVKELTAAYGRCSVTCF